MHQKKQAVQPNPEQQAAIDTMEGPVLVIAGPGTGKTQLLSLRVTNILKNRDVSPESILCLTYTEAGATAMTRRLVRFIGKQAYEVHVSTFHAFASHLRAHYIEYFDRPPFDTLITTLQTNKLLDSFLKNLPINDPLYQKWHPDGARQQIKAMSEFIGKVKKSGLSSEQLRSIITQSLETIDHLEGSTELCARMTKEMPSKKLEKADFCDKLKADALIILRALPSDLTESAVSLPGSYEPLGTYLIKRFETTTFYEGPNNATTGYRALRDEFFDKAEGSFAPKLRNRYHRMQSALNLFDHYQKHLKSKHLYDYDDMILDAIRAIEKKPEFQRLLQNKYQYILVDEFQDTNGSQMRIIELLTEGIENPNIMAVGDDDQAIMRFQGASVAFLKQFEESYPGTKRIVLTTNYRSTPSLVALGQTVAHQIEHRSEASVQEKRLVAHRKEEGPTHFTAKRYETQELQYYAVARAIQQRIAEGFIANAKNPHETIAVIAWKRASLTALIPYLKKLGIDYNYDITQTVAEAETLQGYLAAIHYVSRLVAGDEQRADFWLAQVLTAAELGLPADEYIPFALTARKRGWTTALANAETPRLKELYVWLSRMVKLAASASAERAMHTLAQPFIVSYQTQAENDPFAALEFNYGVAALLDFVTAERTGQSSHEEVSASRGGTAQDSPSLGLRPMKLAEVSALLEEAQLYGVPINIKVPVARPEAITLTTAHSSKGLEYDLVYLLDADQASWKPNKSAVGIAAPNIYLNESADADDMRRLLFVVLTRPRLELEISIGKSDLAAELLDSVEEVPKELSPNEIAVQSTALWQDEYYPENQRLKDLVHSVLAEKSLSVSILNNFVRYSKDEARDGIQFIMQQAFSFPQQPNAAASFGALVHTFFEYYLNYVIKAKTAALDELLIQTRESINCLDFDAAEIASLQQRFDLIVEVFLPLAREYLTEHALSEQWIRAEIDEVPLVGKSDLLIFDEQSKTIRICDWKTGKAKPLDDGYRRQLVFYKLLLEESGVYPGWSVAGGMDIFVEPDAKTHELAPPVLESVPAEEVEHVRSLAKAVYWRIQHANFDTSAFDATGIEKKALQRSFELWLIEDYEQKLSV